ncbi:putative zinc finger protein [Orchesella cincta]|uniref:Putative zinc finger protein n=1 Tax=Orchesella cincta TaxID=48709 RepID=A0A1D2M1L3_ORCCI|nr:putative zinc finger protein [Orchesella cincta]
MVERPRQMCPSEIEIEDGMLISATTSFPNVSRLHNHIRAHIGEKLYKCEICKKNFGRDNHSKIMLTKALQVCVCGEGFNFPKSLDNHIKRHIRENPLLVQDVQGF